MKYIKQLDSVRAIAVLLVIIGHWLPHSFIHRIPTGAVGVDTFFVLSGFLITWILLGNREKADFNKSSKKKLLGSFYIRRTLRIFPIYYLVVFILLLFYKTTDTNINTAYPYFLTYTSNFYFFKIRSWDGILSHLWSLAVEEQFYLLWPSIMIFVNRKYLRIVIYCFIAIGICSQFFLRSVPFSVYLTNSCFDAFGMGALLAWYIVYNPAYLPKLYKILKPLFFVSLLFFLAGIFQSRWQAIPMLRTINSTMAIFVITYLVHKTRNNSLKFSLIWNNSILIFLGKISYGIYLYHYIIPHYTAVVFGDKFYSSFPGYTGTFMVICLNFILLVFLAWLSWRIIENPILRLKKYFVYA